MLRLFCSVLFCSVLFCSVLVCSANAAGGIMDEFAIGLLIWLVVTPIFFYSGFYRTENLPLPIRKSPGKKL